MASRNSNEAWSKGLDAGTYCQDLDVLLTVHFSLFILVINQLDAQKFFFYNKYISCPYMFRAHVLSIKRSKLYYTASSIIKLKKVSGLKLLKYII